jgi:hypothetical protein
MVSRTTHIVSWTSMQPTQRQPSVPMEGRRPKLSPVCINCREKHLRCDGAPQCSRCRRNGAECIFVASRRGMRPNRTNPSTNTAPGLSDDPPFLAPSTSSTISSISSSPSPHHTPQTHSSGSRQQSSARQVFDSSTAPLLIATSTAPPDRLVELFYSRFHQAQQFIVPKAWLLQKQRDPAIYFLRSVVDYIGSSFSSPLHSRVPDPTAVPQHLPNNAFTVQALLVLALWFERVQHQSQYIRHLYQARDCGFAIGLNLVGFAATTSEGCLQLEQSLSATWETVVQRCTSGSFESGQPQLAIEGQNVTRRMTMSSPMAVATQSWVWAETYAEQSAYNPYQLMDAGQLSAQNHAQSLPPRNRSSHTIPGESLDFGDLPLTTTWDDLPTPVTTASASNITSWKP